MALPIPNVATDVQQKIDAGLAAARQAKQRATQLLEAAKRAVEIAIEENEAAGLAYIQAHAKATTSDEIREFRRACKTGKVDIEALKNGGRP